jgi:hypothetical protein
MYHYRGERLVSMISLHASKPIQVPGEWHTREGVR